MMNRLFIVSVLFSLVRTSGNFKLNKVLETIDIVLTDEWQIIPEGQAVPQGGHYRLNIDNGKVEAKLADHTHEEGQKLAVIKTPEDEDEETSPKSIPVYEDVQKINAAIKDFESPNIKLRLASIEDLDLIVRKLEVGSFFIKQPFARNLITLLTDPKTEVQMVRAILRLFTAMIQGNKYVKREISSLNFVQMLMEMHFDDVKVAKSLFTCLGVILRNDEQTIKSFLANSDSIRFIEKNLRLFNLNVKEKIYSILSDSVDSEDISSETKSLLFNHLVNSSICDLLTMDYSNLSLDSSLSNKTDFILQSSYLFEKCLEKVSIPRESIKSLEKIFENIRIKLDSEKTQDWDMKEEQMRMKRLEDALKKKVSEEL